MRWRAALHVSMAAAVGQPTLYASSDTGNAPGWALAGSTVVIGWDNTLIAFDAKTGHKRWSSTSKIPAASHIVRIRAVGGAVVVDALPSRGGYEVVEHILEPSTGDELASLLVYRGEGIVWRDGSSFVAVTPSQLERGNAKTSKIVWSVKLVPAGYRAHGAGLVSALVAGDRVIFGNSTLGYRFVRLKDGKSVAVKDTPSANLLLASGKRLVLTAPGGIYDMSTGRSVWSEADTGLAAFDAKAGIAYFTTEADHRLLGVPVQTGVAKLHPNVLGFSDLVTVYGGVAVYDEDSDSGVLPVTSKYLGRSVTTGAIVWTSPQIPNLELPAGSTGSDLAGGFTCPELRSAGVKYRCPGLEFTAINI